MYQKDAVMKEKYIYKLKKKIFEYKYPELEIVEIYKEGARK